MRAVARRPHPSTSAATTATRFAVLSLFILDIMLARSDNVKCNYIDIRYNDILTLSLVKRKLELLG